MPQFIYFPAESLTYNGHHVLYQTGNEDLLVTYEILMENQISIMEGNG